MVLWSEDLKKCWYLRASNVMTFLHGTWYFRYTTVSLHSIEYFNITMDTRSLRQDSNQLLSTEKMTDTTENIILLLCCRRYNVTRINLLASHNKSLANISSIVLSAKSEGDVQGRQSFHLPCRTLMRVSSSSILPSL